MPVSSLLYFSRSRFNVFSKKESSYPRFKKKGIHDSFYIGNDHIRVVGRQIHIPKLGLVRMREWPRFRGKIISATVSRTADKWFVSLNVELKELPNPCESQGGIIHKNLKLEDRSFKCSSCGLEIDRDLNAAINLFSTVSSTGFQACGEEGSGSDTPLRDYRDETILCEAGTKQ